MGGCRGEHVVEVCRGEHCWVGVVGACRGSMCWMGVVGACTLSMCNCHSPRGYMLLKRRGDIAV